MSKEIGDLDRRTDGFSIRGAAGGRLFHVAIVIVLVSCLPTQTLTGQQGMSGKTLGVIDAWLSSAVIEDDRGYEVELHSMSGWAEDANVRTRIMGTITLGGMGSFDDRSRHYEEVLRQMVLQSGLGEADRISFLARAAGQVSDPELVETLEALLLAGELSVATVEALNRYGVLDRSVAAMNQISGQVDHADAFTGIPQLAENLEHVSSALTVIGALAGAVTVARDVHSQVRAAVLWQALNLDLALHRIAAVRTWSDLRDPAFHSALQRVTSDLQATPVTIWEEMYRAGIRDPDILLGTGMGLMGLGAKLASLSGASTKVMPWVGAVLFSVQQVRLTGEHRADLRRMTAAATLYESLRSRDAGPTEEEVLEALQYLFLHYRRAAFSNWAYNLVWRNVSKDWRELLEEFRTDEARYASDVVDRRISQTIHVLSGHPGEDLHVLDITNPNICNRSPELNQADTLVIWYDGMSVGITDPAGAIFFFDSLTRSWGLEGLQHSNRYGSKVSVDNLRLQESASAEPVLVFRESGTYLINFWQENTWMRYQCSVSFSGRWTPDPLEGKFGPGESLLMMFFGEKSGFEKGWEFYGAEEALRAEGFEVFRAELLHDNLSYRPDPSGYWRLIRATGRPAFSVEREVENLAARLGWLHFYLQRIRRHRVVP